MADRYCIASGDFTSPSIWSATPGGNGGASVPGTGDDIYLDVDAQIQNWHSPLSSNRNVFVRNGASILLQTSTAAPLAFRESYVLDIDGILRTKFPENSWSSCSGNSRILISDRGLFSTQGRSFSDNASLKNQGKIESTQNRTDSVLIRNSNSSSGSYFFGKCYSILLDMWYAVTQNKARFAEFIDCQIFHISTQGGNNNEMIIDFECSSVEINKQFSFGLFPVLATIRQSGTLNIKGDIVSVFSETNIPIQWNLSETGKLRFMGTADQQINMPEVADVLSWTVDKVAGKLELINFSGFLQGRLRNLLVRSSSSIDLSGPSPCLQTSKYDEACYDGLKADATSTEAMRTGWTLEDHRRESMDLVDNYGAIHIPAGKIICTKSFVNRSGATITGNGKLCIREDGLTNLGTIDPNIRLEYFDKDCSATFSAPPIAYSNRTYSVQISGTNIENFRLDWGDGSFSETSEPGVLTHVYAKTNGTGIRTLILTGTSGEGKTNIETKTIELRNLEISPSVFENFANDSSEKSVGIRRDSVPSFYRYSLAQGIYYMSDTMQLFCPMNQNGRSVENGNALFLGRITYSDGLPISSSEIQSARYTIFRLDDRDASVRVPVEGHVDIPLDAAKIILPELMVDENWPFDESGYNFRHVLDDSVDSPFPKAGRNYLVDYTLLVSDAPKIRIQYRVRVV